MDSKTEEINHRENAEDLLTLAITFQADSEKSRVKTRDEYRKLEPEQHNTFRATLDGLIARTSKQLVNKFEGTTDKISYQLSLSASFIRSHYLINDLVMNGDLVEAFTLIRKQLESLTRLHEIDDKPLLKLLKKTPNVINLFGEGGKQFYPSLSEIAHFATPRVGELLTVQSFVDGRVGPSLYPAWNVDALACYDRHAYVSLYFAFWFIEFLRKIYGKSYDSELDEKTFFILTGMAEESGIIQLPKLEKE